MGDSRRPEVVVITGASAGVGRATVRRFAREGARIGLVARGRDGLEEARREAEDAGASALVLPTDVADSAQVEAAAAAVEQRFGPIDAWINVAMTSVFSPVKEMRPEEYERVLKVNFLGYVHGTLAALARMLPRDRGIIVQASSALAYRSIPLQSAYCASKHAIVGFTESLRSELIHDGSRVRVCMVHLPGMNTPQFLWSKSRLPYKPQPVPPIFQPEVAADALYWAAHHDRRDIKVGSPTVKAIWGNRVIPGLLDHWLAKVGYTRQMTDEPVNPDRLDNLWAPVPWDFGAHGPFDRRAKASSLELWFDIHRWSLGAAALGAAALVGAAARRAAARRSAPWRRLLA
ncbi:SDR family oxidoreductase [Sorangium sp. So ce185]|uniref:SDR family oxidoreductase n=1 Tax=Sorangium sp. So ce185 TaxID=3133287 RepID=UPI003F600D54